MMVPRWSLFGFLCGSAFWVSFGTPFGGPFLAQGGPAISAITKVMLAQSRHWLDTMAKVGHVPCPSWACPMPRLGMSHAQVEAHPMSRGLGTHFGGPGTQVGGSVRPLEAEGRLFGGPGAEPPGISPILAMCLAMVLRPLSWQLLQGHC